MADAVEANTAAGQSASEQQLLDVLSAFEDAHFNQDAEALKKLLADDVVQHADRIVTDHDRQGAEKVSLFFAKYYANYKFKHFPVVRAVNAATNSVYCMWDDEDVIMKPESFDEELPASGSMTSLSGIWRLVLNSSLKVKEIWFLRQLTREEKKHRLNYRPSQLYSDFHAKSLVGPTLDLSEKQIAKMHAAAEAFNEAWRTGDPSAVHDLLAPDCHTVNPIFGDKKASRQEWEETLKDVFRFWQVKSNTVDIAVTPSSNKAFIWWHVQGVQKDTKQDNDMYGLNLLVFDTHRDMCIKDIVGYRQPLQSEVDHIFKAGSYQDKLSAAGSPKKGQAPMEEAGQPAQAEAGA